jgi:hypothetical protein
MGFPAVWAAAVVGTTANGNETANIAAAASIDNPVSEIALFGTPCMWGTFRSYRPEV